MKIQTILATIATGAITTLASQAAITFNITNIDTSNTAGASAAAGGSAAVSISPASFDGSATGQYTISVTGLDVDGVGGTDDSLSLLVNVTPAGGTIRDSAGDLGVNGAGAGRISGTGETLTFSFVSGSTVLGSPAPNTVGTFVFEGFNAVQLSQMTADDDTSTTGDVGFYQLGAGPQTNITDDANTTFANSTDDLTVGYISGYDGTNQGNDGFFINDIQLRVTADFAVVPEPSSAALLGLGGLALVLRRRK
ncbi:hypothetical protein NT6N_08690 [Oceaniferula spumae]|uniref:Ice-binding protein C-terminal domain-containing protein n=1 Tax=Oceaniferula spumae TaxID=2979115 RepID=A0AAT9FIK3_9BACT